MSGQEVLPHLFANGYRSPYGTLTGTSMAEQGSVERHEADVSFGLDENARSTSVRYFARYSQEDTDSLCQT